MSNYYDGYKPKRFYKTKDFWFVRPFNRQFGLKFGWVGFSIILHDTLGWQFGTMSLGLIKIVW